MRVCVSVCVLCVGVCVCVRVCVGVNLRGILCNIEYMYIP